MPSLLELKKGGELNSYLYSQLRSKLTSLPKQMQQQMVAEAISMTAVGIKSGEDHKHFAYIKQHIRKIAEELSCRKLKVEILAKLSGIVYSDRKKQPIDTISNFYNAVSKALSQLDISIEKKAYPVGSGPSYMNSDQPHNVGKWMSAMRNMYAKMHKGYNSNKAFDIVTSNWDVMEKQDFKGWLRFYQEGAHDKYKTAQYYQLGGDGPPVLPMRALEVKLPSSGDGMPNMSRFDNNADVLQEDRKAAVEKARRSAVGRLQSAERLMTKPEILNALKGFDLSKWLESLHSLTRDLYNFNLASTQSVSDLIVKHSNILKSEGHKYGGFLLEKIAQAPQAPTVEDLEAGVDASGPPMDPGMGIDMPPIPEGAPGPEGLTGPMDALEDPQDDPAMEEFIMAMNNEFLEEDEDMAIDDSFSDDAADITVTAQALPPEMQQRPLPNLGPATPIERPAPAPVAKPTPAADIVVDEPLKDVGEELFEPEEPKAKALDPLDNIDVNIEDIINRLDSVADILRKREIPRQLGIVDLMLDKIGFAGFFPTLAEAHRSSLESNQYMATRIEDVLAKLRGAQAPQTQVELSTTPEEVAERDDTLEQVRRNLSDQEKKEREKKDKRKANQEAKERAADVQQETARELAGPADVQTAPPARIR